MGSIKRWFAGWHLLHAGVCFFVAFIDNSMALCPPVKTDKAGFAAILSQQKGEMQFLFINRKKLVRFFIPDCRKKSQRQKKLIAGTGILKAAQEHSDGAPAGP